MSAKHPEGEYAFWTVPGTAFTISYWLSLFHEIDFQVNEGYRRIPHGGIEIGGLLFGQSEENSARIEAFRPIECEHSRGPSFVLSERDVTRLREQISTASSDAELRDFELLGCFIAHTRSPLEVNERENLLVDDLFPEPGKLLLLIKPERFQPTRFLFLVRGPDGNLAGAAPEHAVILPLPGRSDRSAEGPLPSIPAPAPKTPAPAPEPEPLLEPPAPPQVPVSAPPPEPALETPLVTSPPPLPPRVAPVTEPPPTPPLPVSPPPEPAIAASSPAVQDLPSIDHIRRRRSEVIREPATTDAPAAHQQITQPTIRHTPPSNTRLAIVLFIAAALGCAVGYTIYLQLPPAVIPLNIRSHTPALIVSWPPEQTRDAVYAALRVDDGDPIPLSAQQKQEGQAAVPATPTGNVKIELMAQHWMRDSRGILRYVEPLPASSPSSAGAPSQ
jgi:hypothetical protein